MPGGGGPFIFITPFSITNGGGQLVLEIRNIEIFIIIWIWNFLLRIKFWRNCWSRWGPWCLVYIRNRQRDALLIFLRGIGLVLHLVYRISYHQREKWGSFPIVDNILLALSSFLCKIGWQKERCECSITVAESPSVVPEAVMHFLIDGVRSNKCVILKKK